MASLEASRDTELQSNTSPPQQLEECQALSPDEGHNMSEGVVNEVSLENDGPLPLSTIPITENIKDHISVERQEPDESQHGREAAQPRRTRSGARFSDDTNMLKDFLNRAQARKAAKSQHESNEPNCVYKSPRRSPRKILGQLDTNSPSPKKGSHSIPQPSTPKREGMKKLPEPDEIDELSIEAPSCRRSARTKILAPQAKTASGAPSYIPVRRQDGADPVVLQKSDAQELAIATRINTKRNKGQSKPPILTLRTLDPHDVEAPTSRKHGRKGAKSVDWDERLIYFSENFEANEGEDDKRPKVKRVKGLGAVNGTPAPKRKVANIPPRSGTPAPKRRGKVNQ